ncbi:DinB family protein [Tenacibaculum caenipelagi]|nr:DinB family protein [Tenacibaculum caenipelagi]
MEKEIVKKYEKVTGKLIQLLSSLSDKQLNTLPSTGGWSAAQVGDHLSRSYDISEVLKGKVEETHRSPDQKLNDIQGLFLDLETKMDSPKDIMPSEETIDKKKLLTSLQDKIQNLKKATKNMDLSKTCLDFSIPGFGSFTRLEWIGFNTVHTQRHIHQLEQIIENIKQ